MAAISNLYIDQGTDFNVTVDVTNIDGSVLNLSNYTAVSQIRKTYGSSTVSATFASTSIAAAQGQVTLTLTDTQTAGLTAGRYVYDLNITSSAGQTTRVVEGQVVLTPGVTR